MTDWTAAVKALYDELGGWKEVANACNGADLTHSAGYYQQVATGRIKKPNAETRLGIENAPEYQESLLKSRFSKDTRKTVHPFDADHAAGNLERIERGLTWPQMIHEWRKSHALMRREYGE